MTRKNQIVLLFCIATQSLLCAGYLLSKEVDLIQFLLTSWVGLSGTILIYGFDFGYGAGKKVVNYLRNSRQHPWQSIFLVQFIFVSLPLAFYFLSWNRILTIGLIGAIGFIYSLHFPFVKEGFRFKRLFIVKNIFIGFAWGALILVGAGTLENQLGNLLFWFMSLQIVVGSIVRDCADTEHDEKLGVKTLPLKFGIKRTIPSLHLANLSTGLVIVALPFQATLFWVICLTVLWRTFVIWKVGHNQGAMFWTQTLNILTCLVFFFLLLIVSI